jgi:lysine 2,3-aminomutase
MSRTYEYFDPIHTLPEEGQSWWREHAGDSLAEAEKHAAASRAAAESQKLLTIH